MDVRLPDGTLIRGIPDGMSKADLTAKLKANGYDTSGFDAPPKQSSVDAYTSTAKGDSVADNVLAGIGGSMKGPYVGIRQLLGQADPAEVQDWLDSMKGLSSTGGGIAGQVLGGAALPVAASVLAGPAAASLVPAIGMGAAFGFSEPVGPDESRTKNTLKGAAFNAAIPFASAVGSVVKRGMIDPFMKSGQEGIAGRVLNRFASNPYKAAADAADPLQYVKGSNPTLGEATLDPGLATLQETLRSTDSKITKNALINQFQQNSAAQLAALRGVTKTPQELEKAITKRSTESAANYSKAFADGIDPASASAFKPQIDNILGRLPDGVMNEAKEMAKLKGINLSDEGSVEGLHFVKLALDERIAGAASATKKQALTQLKSDFMSTLDEVAPAYKDAVAAHAKNSKPINAMETGQKLYSKVTRALMEGTEAQTIKPDVFANALRDEVSLVKSATGRSATLRELFPDADIKQLNAIKKDLQRQVRAQGLAKVNGSPTAQYLVGQDILRQNIGPIGLPRGFAENALASNFLSRPASFALKVPEDAVKGLLSEAMTDPKFASMLMDRAAKPGGFDNLLSGRAYNALAPALGYSGGLLMDLGQ